MTQFSQSSYYKLIKLDTASAIHKIQSSAFQTEHKYVPCLKNRSMIKDIYSGFSSPTTKEEIIFKFHLVLEFFTPGKLENQGSMMAYKKD